MDETNTLYQERLKKLASFKGLRLYEKPVVPYGGRFERSGSLSEIVSAFEEGKKVKVAGRLMALRRHGKTGFADLRDQTGKLQLYIKEETVGGEAFAFFEKLDIGDIVGAEGSLFKTKTGEPSVRVERLELLSKNLRPLPEKWHGLKDVETRIRQRYVDLLMSEEVRSVFVLRSRLIQKMRHFLDKKGFLEVETPMMHPIPGGAAGDPFKTHHKTLDMELYLRLAPELYLKKLLVGGFEKVYEIAKSFRNEGISAQHNPEFTMLEAYAAYWNYEDMMIFMEEMIATLVEGLLGTTKVKFGNLPEIDFAPPWRRFSFTKELKDIFDIDPGDSEKEMIQKLKKRKESAHLELKENLTRSQIVNLVSDLVAPHADKPVFVIDYYTAISPLAKSKKENPDVAERFELFVGGMEVANGYSELNDPVEQMKRFETQADGDASKIDGDFVKALEYGMPPAAGLGVGIDRLTMLFANQRSIREVILFPQLKPEK